MLQFTSLNFGLVGRNEGIILDSRAKTQATDLRIGLKGIRSKNIKTITMKYSISDSQAARQASQIIPKH
jgi:hypothetical protein